MMGILPVLVDAEQLVFMQARKTNGRENQAN
jgi:hypothetical protein